MPRKDAPVGPISAQAQQDLVSDGIENFELPKSLITKIAKSALPESAKLQKETVLSLVKGSTVFINYLAATYVYLVLTHSVAHGNEHSAHDVAISKQHKSISASDVLKALEMIEFGDLVDKLQTELVVYRANAKTDKKKAPTSTGPGPAPSISAPPRPPKGKGKAGTSKEKDRDLGAPFTSVPLAPQRERDVRMEVDWEEELGEAAAASASASYVAPEEEYDDLDLDPEEGEGELADEGEGEEDPEEDVGDDEEDEGEVVNDPMEIEEAELKRDARGLEDPEVLAAAASVTPALQNGHAEEGMGEE
ncbi:hypothetical protein DXG01_010923 [Tephrocybe rancida]|nr:hypothetical protein DXG01_010923 [Tephrocybe rancida]